MYTISPKTMQHSPVILFVSNQAVEREAVDRWLNESRYTICDAVDVFQALEHVSDFTTGKRPDLIRLHVDSVASDIEFMRTMVATPAGESDVPIIDLTSDLQLMQNGQDFDSAIEDLVCRLDKFIPHQSAARV